MKTITLRVGKLLLLGLLLSLMVACGQKGDLYLPDETDKKQDFGSR